MNYMPQIEPITSMNRNHKAVLEKLAQGPIYLAQRSKGVAVMISPQDWEEMNVEITRLKALNRALLAAQDDDPTAWVPFDLVEEEMKAEGLLDS